MTPLIFFNDLKRALYYIAKKYSTMKQLIFLLFIASFLVFGCVEPPVVFNDAQPTGLEAKAYFEPIYRGVFQCESDSGIVYVKAKTIYKELTYQFKTSIAEIDSLEESKLTDGQLWIEGLKDPIPVNIEGDSVSGALTFRDTLFEVGENQVLKYFRGHHILNKRIDEDKWEVLVLSVDYDLNLRLSEAVMPEDLSELEKITPVKDISTEDKSQILLVPTVAEFKELLKSRLLFQECDLYKRLKLPTAI